MINEIPKTGGLTPQPTLQAPNRASPSGGVEATVLSRPGAPAGAVLNKPPAAEAVGLQESQVKDVAQGLQQLVQTVQRQLNFSVDKDTGSTVIKVLDAETGDMVRQIPSEEILTLQRRLAELDEAGQPADASVLQAMLFSART